MWKINISLPEVRPVESHLLIQFFFFFVMTSLGGSDYPLYFKLYEGGVCQLFLNYYYCTCKSKYRAKPKLDAH